VRATAGVWYRESGDCIRGCDGACFHVVDSLAGAGGWNITNVAALYIFFVTFIFASGWDQEGKSFSRYRRRALIRYRQYRPLSVSFSLAMQILSSMGARFY